MKDNDIFHGDNKKLVASIEALLALDAKGALVPHGIGEHARTLLATGLQRLIASNERVDVLERALCGMLFAFDDGVGREWSADLLDFARALTPAFEFKLEPQPMAGLMAFIDDMEKPRPIRFADLPVTQTAFDRVTAERDAALGREDALREELHEIKESMAYRGSFLGRVQAERDSLQQRLTAAEGQADVLYGTCVEQDGLLREWRHCVGPRLRDIVSLHQRTYAALKPAEGGGDET